LSSIALPEKRWPLTFLIHQFGIPLGYVNRGPAGGRGARLLHRISRS
jgi:hypothetical protein